MERFKWLTVEGVTAEHRKVMEAEYIEEGWLMPLSVETVELTGEMTVSQQLRMGNRLAEEVKEEKVSIGVTEEVVAKYPALAMRLVSEAAFHRGLYWGEWKESPKWWGKLLVFVRGADGLTTL